MDIFIFLSNFIYRIRYKLLIGVSVAALLTIYMTSFIPKVFHVTTTIFTGITSKTSVDDSGRTDWNTSNNAHENIVNLIKSKSTREAVSIKLLAQHLIYGDPKNDNKYITAEHYRDLMMIVPAQVKALVVRPMSNSVQDLNKAFNETVANLNGYKREGKGNFIYEIFNWDNPYYGNIALGTITAARKGASDMIEVNYECDDAGIASNTLRFLNEELSLRYEGLLLSASIDVVKYFEEQLVLAREKLQDSETELVQFNLDNKIINYEEQTKHLAALNNTFESRYEEILMTYNSSKALVEEMQQHMNTRTKLMMENDHFLQVLNDISITNGRIAEIEIFGASGKDTSTLNHYRKELTQHEQKIKNISDNLELYKFSKEGIILEDMVSQWLDATIKFVRSKAELEVINKRREQIQSEFETYSPVGPNLSRRGREVKINEESYLTIHRFLAEARLKQKNILLDAGTLQIVTPPDIPLLVNPRKREIFVLMAMAAAIIFVIGFYLIIELFDRTIRDGQRAARLTTGKVIGAFPNNKIMTDRRFSQQISRISTSYLANQLNAHIRPDAPMIINMLSIEPGEGKSAIAENLNEYWTESGLKVAMLTCDIESAEQYKKLVGSQSIYDLDGFSEQIKNADIIIAEYKALKDHNIPKKLLQEATANILVLNAERPWYPSDGIVFENLRSADHKDNIFIYLNNAAKEAVEMYTGQLPPYTLLRKWGYRFMNFGITAKS